MDSDNLFAVIGVLAFIVFLVALIVMFMSIYTIRSGYVGTLCTWGKCSLDEVGAGLHFKTPIAQNVVRTSIMDTQAEEVMQVPSKEGLVFELDVSVIYSVVPDKASDNYVSVTGNIAETILIPYLRNIVRDMVSGYEAKSLYSEQEREAIASQVKLKLEEKVKDELNIRDVLFRRVTLPDAVKTAIESKINAEQVSLQKDFELITAQKNAEITVAQAQGVAQANKIIGNSISENYLRYRWIEGLQTNQMMVVYVPTEGNIPIMEAGRMVDVTNQYLSVSPYKYNSTDKMAK